MAATPHQAASFRLLTAAAAMFLVIFIVAPMAAPVLVPAAALVLVAVILMRVPGRSRGVPLASALAAPSRLFVALGIAGIYLLINASWSLAPRFAYASLGLYFALVLVSLLMVSALQESSRAIAHANALGLCIGMALGSAFLLFEVLSEQAAVRLLMSRAPALLQRCLPP